MGTDWIVVTFYFICTTTGLYWVYRCVKNWATGRYISIDKIGEYDNEADAREAVIRGIEQEPTEDGKLITGEF